MVMGSGESVKTSFHENRSFPSLPAPLSPFQEKRGTFLFTFTYPCWEQSLFVLYLNHLHQLGHCLADGLGEGDLDSRTVEVVCRS